ncbi:helix-turn-helix transcriptional regulator [uncultured Clostridium sp.]|uniref:helix-turn-helix domain-containing protein n=1 Tax=uncultured Clostridium sp. TaxID=59620 RepID=UPI0028E951C1|nr:helix-turn-helix transcriptional regulator [uncultured Clostridium sp.]
MLKDARKKKGLSQKSLAERLGITQSYLSRLENRDKYDKKVTVDLAKRISEELDLKLIDVVLYFCN